MKGKLQRFSQFGGCRIVFGTLCIILGRKNEGFKKRTGTSTCGLAQGPTVAYKYKQMKQENDEGREVHILTETDLNTVP
ncbi:hypothetical protein GCM10010967_46710 [Dyadobacter beijingensis]|uniref:Uncharacterized protein n=1 Tax=Dyadobacter beijingensis TaxID=365489 RepID=A0ABQ2IE23_9BACT|nr:hypothetical protein GCM10010967_46710 [Dyadobacter beijingensis]